MLYGASISVLIALRHLMDLLGLERQKGQSSHSRSEPNSVLAALYARALSVTQLSGRRATRQVSRRLTVQLFRWSRSGHLLCLTTLVYALAGVVVTDACRRDQRTPTKELKGGSMK